MIVVDASVGVLALLNHLAADDAGHALRTWAQLGLRRFATVGLIDRIWALRENLTAYDASHVALAEGLDCPLATADARLANAPGPTCTITVVRR